MGGSTNRRNNPELPVSHQVVADDASHRSGGPGLGSHEALCIAFANSAEWTEKRSQVDRLSRADGVAQWLTESALMVRTDAEAVIERARVDLASAERVVAIAAHHRKVVRTLLSKAASGAGISDSDLGPVNELLEDAMSRFRVCATDSGIRWQAAAGSALSRALATIAWSAVELLTTPALAVRLRCCAEPGCGTLFLDQSRNASRRWCDMRGCGNRAKARRHYARRRGVPGAGRSAVLRPVPVEPQGAQADGVR
jgi:predicted RNA-binding Zn ribbon-like protein